MNSKKLSEDPVAVIIAIAGIVIAVTAAVVVAVFVVIPVVLLTIAAILLYRYLQLERMKGPEKLPATVKERDDYLTPDAFLERVVENRLLNEYEEETGRYSCKPLADWFAKVAADLYADESFHQPPPRPDTT